MARKNKKNKNKQLDYFDRGRDSDETFAYIAGYTSGGAPYGFTREQWEIDEEDDNKPKSLSPGINDKDLPF